MDIDIGDTIIIGETRYRVLAVSATHVYTRRDSAAPHEVSYFPLASIGQEGIRVEKRKAGEL